MAKRQNKALHPTAEEVWSVLLRVMALELARMECRIIVLERRLGIEVEAEPLEPPVQLDEWRRKEA